MAIISITILASSEQILSGIPRFVTLTTNLSSTIFYTLDGSTPTVLSSVYVSPIEMPTNLATIILKVFATNGVDSSAIISTSYTTNIINDTRLPHAAVTNLNNNNMNSLFPFGTSSPNPTFNYINPASSGTTVNNPLLPVTSLGVDVNGNPIVNINAPVESYTLTYSDTNSKGEVGPGIGDFPATTKIIGKTTPINFTQEISKTSDKLFNPKALVIFQDALTEDTTNPAIINRQQFSLAPLETTRDGTMLTNVGLETSTTSGTYLKSYYNDRTQELTSYYFDGSVNRWIISKFPYQSTNPKAGVLYDVVFGRGKGGQYVYKWIQNPRRVLI